MRNRWCLLALVAGLGLCLSGPPRQRAAAEPDDKVARLVKQLGSPRFADRERARRELEAIGAPALKALTAAARGDDRETGRQAREILDHLQAKLLTDSVLSPKRVKLTFKDMSVIDAVDELVRQSGYNIQIQGAVANLVKRKVTLDTGETTFWQAFDQLCHRAGLVEVASAAPLAGPWQQDPQPNFRPGRRPQPFQIQPFKLQPFPLQPRQLQPGLPLPGDGLKVPKMPGVLKVEDGPGQGIQVAQLRFPRRDGFPDDEQLRQLEQQLQQQIQQLLQQFQQQLQQMQPGQPPPGQPGFQFPGRGQQQQFLQQFLRQMQQLQMQQFGQPGQPGLLNRPGQEPPDPEIRQINVKDGTPAQAPTFYAGAVRLRILLVAGQGKADREALLALDVSVEPKVYSFTLAPETRVERAVDDEGQALTATLTNGLTARAHAPRLTVDSRQPVLQLKLGEKRAKNLTELSGHLAGQMLAQSDPLIVVDDIFNAAGKTAKGEKGGSIKVFAVEKKGDGEVQVQLRLESPPAQADGLRGAGLPSLVDAKGESYQLVQVPSRARRTNGRVVTQELTLLYRANPGQGDPSKLVLNGVRPVSVRVPFSLRNVPLP